MSDKSFLIRTFSMSVFVIVILIGVNIYLDIYGLFRSVDDRKLSVFYNERITKYLFAYNYIPSNYNAVLVGTSLSDNLNFTEYQNSLSIFNGSIMGANISEVRDLSIECINNGVENFVICVSPYQFKNAGGKEVSFSKKLSYSALGSLDLYQTYFIALVRQFDLLPNKYPKDQFDANGVNDYDKLFEVSDVSERINEEAKQHTNEEIVINQQAFSDFKELISLMNENDINYMVYFHPTPKKVYDANQFYIDQFQNQITSVLGSNVPVLNFNTKPYSGFASDYTNYIDHGHLSKKGQQYIVASIYDFISEDITLSKMTNN